MQTVFQKSLTDTMLYHKIPVFQYNIQYPAFASPCSQTAVYAINQFYASLAKDKEAYCRSILYPQAVDSARYIQENIPPFRYYEFIMTYNVTFNSGCIVSLYREEYTYMGGAHGSTLRMSDTWNFKTGQRIQLKDLSAYDSEDKLLMGIDRQIAELLKTSAGSFFDNYTLLVRNTFHPNSFYLTPNGIVIYFQQYDIAPYAAGLPEFLFPFHA